VPGGGKDAGTGGDFAGTVESGVGERVGFAVEFARYVLDGEIGEAFGLAQGALVKRLERGAFYFVAALHLADKKFGIAANAEAQNICGGTVIERGDEREVFGDVVGGAAEILSKLIDDRAVGAANDDGVRGGPGIAARGTIHFGGENICGVLRLGEKAGGDGVAAARSHGRGFVASTLMSRRGGLGIGCSSGFGGRSAAGERRSDRLGVIKDAAAGFAEIIFLVIGAAKDLVDVRADADATLHTHFVANFGEGAVAMLGDALVFVEKRFGDVGDNGFALGFGGGEF